MPSKRKHNSNQSLPNAKRSKDSHNYQHDASQPRVNPTTGQRGALPGLDDDDDGDAEHSDELTNEALAYLRSVRTEAQLIPPVLVAPPPLRSDLHSAIYAAATPAPDTRGYYADGAYVARPTLGPHFPASTDGEAGAFNHYQDWDADADDSGDGLVPAEQAYHAALLVRFASTRALLARAPPAPSPAGLDGTTHEEAARWRGVLGAADPGAAQLAGMRRDAVLRVLGIAGSSVKRGRLMAGGEEGRRVGAWVWGLLARVGHVGTLVSEEVAVVREVGKRAAAVVRGFEKLEEEEEEEEEEEGEWEEGEGDVDFADDASVMGGPGEGEAGADAHMDGNPAGTNKPEDQEGTDVDADLSTALEAAKAKLLSQYTATDEAVESTTSSEAQKLQEKNDEPPIRPDDSEQISSRRHTAFATLDAILTIVGECYGQRDLLGARSWLWESDMALKG